MGTDTELALGGAQARAMIFQQSDETAAELAVRVGRRLNLMQQGGTPIDVAVIATSDAADPETHEARCEIARTLLDSMEQRSPRLVFAASVTTPQATRHALLEVAGHLTSQVYSSPVEVSVRFSSPAERKSTASSGLHRIAPAALEEVA